MGHTVKSQRRVVERVSNELKRYAKSLRSEEQPIFNDLIKKPFLHIGSITYTSSAQTWAFMLLSTLLEQEKKIIELETKYNVMVNGRVSQRQRPTSLAKNKK